MSVAKKCDACGGFYEETGASYKYGFDTIVLKTWYSASKHMELCPECRKKVAEALGLKTKGEMSDELSAENA